MPMMWERRWRTSQFIPAETTRKGSQNSVGEPVAECRQEGS